MAENTFKVGDICRFLNGDKSTLVFPENSLVKIVKLSHPLRKDAITVEAVDGVWKGSTGYCFPEEIRPLTKLEKAL